MRTYGYPKDNAFPPALSMRLTQPQFVLALRESIRDDEHQPEHLLQALETLTTAAHQKHGPTHQCCSSSK
ncbi:MAG: hypothetical protein AAFS10_00235 [Myxococcota bacterium]